MVFRMLSVTDRDRVLTLARKAGRIRMLSAANRAAQEFFHQPLLAGLPDFPAWPEFRRAAFRSRPLHAAMPWRGRWEQRIRLRRMLMQMGGDLQAPSHRAASVFFVSVSVPLL